MTRSRGARRASLGVGWRLSAGLLPSVLGVALVVGLFYYGEVGRAVPRLVLLLAVLLTAVSLAATWVNARYFAERITRLARAAAGASSSGTAGGRADEFDRIERAVGDLGSALSAAEAERTQAGAAADAQRRDEATMLAAAVGDALSLLDDVRLPLHILLETRFGELNENQEELLRDARTAADAIDAALRRLAQVADVDRGAFVVTRELIQVNDVVRSVAPIARAAAARHEARIAVELEPGLPRVLADRARLAEALALIAVAAAEATGPDTPLRVATAREEGRTIIRVAPAVEPAVLARRLIEAQGGAVAPADGSVGIRVGG
jgi:signal transduction histidine kinase